MPSPRLAMPLRRPAARSSRRAVRWRRTALWRHAAGRALVVVPVAGVLALSACSRDVDPVSSAPRPSDTGTVLLPRAAGPATTDSAGHPIEQLPVLPPAPLSGDRVRGLDYSYAVPVGWSEGRRDVEAAPDTVVLPDDTDVSALVAVERPFPAGSRTLPEVVDKLRAGFEAKGLAPKAAPERDLAGYHAQGIVVDQSAQMRHVYYVAVYTGKVFAVRLSYDPASPSALAVYRGVLDSWTWG